VATLRSFKHRNYRILYPANAVSNIGTWAQRVAQDWLVLELTGSSLYLGIVTGLQFVPALLFSMQGGKMADRFNKRRVLIYCNLGGFVSSFALGILILTDLIQLWHVFFFAFTLGLASALDAPVRQAFTSEIVGKADLPNAVSLNSANFNAARLIGPGLSGLLIAAFGTGPSFLLNALSFLGVVVSLYAIRESELFIEAKPNINSKVREAIAYIKARPDLYGTMIVVFFATTFGFNFAIYNALMTTKVFGLGVEVFGALGSILAIGSLTGALVSAKFEKKRTPKQVMFGVMGFGCLRSHTSLHWIHRTADHDHRELLDASSYRSSDPRSRDGRLSHRLPRRDTDRLSHLGSASRCDRNPVDDVSLWWGNSSSWIDHLSRSQGEDRKSGELCRRRCLGDYVRR
jgi:MFS family permease